MCFHLLFLFLGFVLLIKGADFFVDGAASTARNFKVSKSFIGLTIIAFGTSLPEFAISMKALASGSADMLLGNVIGSNILNILLILGIAATIHPITVKKNTIEKELPLIMLISTLLVVLFLDIKLSAQSVNQITRSDGIVILLFFSIFVYYLVSLLKHKKEDNEEPPKRGILKSLLFVIIGLAGVIIGSDLVVNNAISLAIIFGISERLIALTIIALGTSLPELVTTVVSAKKGEQDMLLGNVIGSNIFNICVVLGIPVSIYGTITQSSFKSIDLIMLVTSSIILFIFSKTKKKITRTEGILLLLMFVIYYISIFII